MKFSGIIVAMAIIFLWGQSMAQDVTGGIKGGLNISNLYIDDVDDENAKLAGHAGFFVNAKVGRFFSVQPELLYSMKGSEINYNNILADGKVRYNLNYIDLPVVGVIHLGPVRLEAGPYVSLLTSANIKDLDDDGNTQFEDELDRDDFNTVDYGAVGGMGIDFGSGLLGLRYNYGMREVAEKGTTLGQFTSNSKNSVLNIYVGFKF